MKKILFLILILLLASCQSKITNFEECAKAGNPIMESYPRQCRANGELFVEQIKEEIRPEPIGGQRDEHGCLGPAGYSWNSKVGACIREWELKEEQRKAAKIAVEYNGQERGLTIVKVDVAKCEGCFTVQMDREGERVTIMLKDWEPETGLEIEIKAMEYCGEEDVDAVEICNGYAKVISSLTGAGSRFYSENGTEIRCPIVAPDAMSKECKELLFDLECEEVC